jgi:hypothetical protein
MSSPAPEPTAAGEPGYHQPVVDDRRITEIMPESDGPDPVRFQASIGATFKRLFRGTPHAEHRDLSVGAETLIAAYAAICAVENAWRNDPDRLTPVRRHQLAGRSQFANESIVIDEAWPHHNDDDGPCSGIGRFIPTPYTTHRIPVKIAVDGGEGHNDEVITLRQINGEEYPIWVHWLHINHQGKLAAAWIKEPKLTPDARECIMTAILCLTPCEQTEDRQMAGFLPTELRRYLLLRFVDWDSWAGKPWPATVSYDTDGTLEYNDD